MSKKKEIELGNLVRRVREEHKLSVMELAAKCHLNYLTIYRMETGKGSSMYVFARVIDALQIDPAAAVAAINRYLD